MRYRRCLNALGHLQIEPLCLIKGVVFKRIPSDSTDPIKDLIA